MKVKDRVQLILNEVEGVASMYDVDSWELAFLKSIQGRTTLSPKQEEKLIEIEHKVFKK